MNPKILLRLSATFISIHMLGHAIGHFSWRETKDPVKQTVINNMTTHDFLFMGSLRSMADYYEGYSLILFIVYVLSIWLLLVITDLFPKQPEIAVRLLLPMALTYLAFSIVEYAFFFPFAAGISLGTGLLIATSIVFIRR